MQQPASWFNITILSLTRQGHSADDSRNGFHLPECCRGTEAKQVQLFYVTDRKKIYGLVETFNFRPNEFKYMSVIAELEQSGLGAKLKCAQNQDKT